MSESSCRAFSRHIFLLTSNIRHSKNEVGLPRKPRTVCVGTGSASGTQKGPARFVRPSCAYLRSPLQGTRASRDLPIGVGFGQLLLSCDVRFHDGVSERSLRGSS